MSTSDRLAEIKARAAAATPGPWKASHDICDCGWDYACGHGTFIDGIELPDSKIERADGDYQTYDYIHDEIIEFTHETRDFLVHSRADVDWLVAEVERLTARRQAELDELKAKCGKQADMLAKHCQRRDEVLALLDRFDALPADDLHAETLIDRMRNLLGGAR